MKTLVLVQIPLQLVLLGVAAVIGLFAGFILAFTAPLHSPGWVEELMCPPGTQLESEWYRATYNEPGEQTLSVTCVDAQGLSVPRINEDAGMLTLIGRFSAICVGGLFCPLSLVVLMLGVFIARRKRS
jgi:hypothetical protein